MCHLCVLPRPGSQHPCWFPLPGLGELPFLVLETSEKAAALALQYLSPEGQHQRERRYEQVSTNYCRLPGTPADLGRLGTVSLPSFLLAAGEVKG